MRFVRNVPVFVLAATVGALAQSAAAPGPTFDAVSIKRNTSDRPPVGVLSRGNLPDGSLHLTWTPVMILVGMAYPAPTPDYIVGLPDWAKRDHYDVVATSPFKTVTPEQRVAMLRAMLADRLKLAAHVEKRPHDVMRLVLARKDGRLGDNLTRIDTDCAAVLAARQAAAAAGGPPAPRNTPTGPLAPCFARMVMGRTGLAHVEGEGTIDNLSTMLRGAARQVVVNNTGLAGYFRFALDFDMRSSFAGPSTTLPDDAGPSVFTALQEQLGLKLVSAREDEDTVVIDHIEPPSEN